MAVDADHQLLSKLLQSSGRALASYAASELVESVPESQEGCGPDPFSMWRYWLSSRIEELAAALAAGRPELFVAQVQWGRAALELLKGVFAQELPEEMQDVALQYVDRALEGFNHPARESVSRLQPETPAGKLIASYLLAVLEGDRRSARELVLDGNGQVLSIPQIYTDVLLPAQEEIGRMWLTNEITVAEEHFATSTTRSLMAQLLARATLGPRTGKTLLAAAVAGNRHDIGLLAVADFFEIGGWKVIHLGADAPVSDVVQSIRCFSVDLLALSASQPPQLQTVQRTIEAARVSDSDHRLKILTGGLAFRADRELALELGADDFASSPIEAVRIGNQLFGLAFDPSLFAPNE